MKKLVILASAMVMATAVAPIKAEERKSGWKVFKAVAKFTLGTAILVYEVKRITLGLIVDKEAVIAAVNEDRRAELNSIEQGYDRNLNQITQDLEENNDIEYAIGNSSNRHRNQILRRANINYQADLRIRDINNIGSVGISNIFGTALGSALVYSGYKDFTEKEEHKEKVH